MIPGKSLTVVYNIKVGVFTNFNFSFAGQNFGVLCSLCG